MADSLQTTDYMRVFNISFMLNMKDLFQCSFSLSSEG